MAIKGYLRVPVILGRPLVPNAAPDKHQHLLASRQSWLGVHTNTSVEKKGQIQEAEAR